MAVLRSASASKPAIGFVGLGRMGGPMALRLLTSGYTVTVFDLDAEAVGRLVASGGVRAETLADVVTACDTVFVMVPPTRARELLIGEGGIVDHVHGGQVIVDGGNSNPAVSREVARIFSERGTAFLDIGFSGAPGKAADGTLAIMAGGDAAAFQKIEAALAELGPQPLHLGPSGSGHLAKALNHLVMSISSQAIGEALAIGKSNGLDMRKWLSAAATGTAGSWLIDRATDAMDVIDTETPPDETNMNDWWAKVLTSNQLVFSAEAAAAGSVEAPLAQLAGQRRTQSGGVPRDAALESYVRLTWSFAGPDPLK